MLLTTKIDLSEFLPHVMVHVQGDTRAPLAPEAALSFIRQSAIKFAEKSRVLCRKITITLEEGVCVYPLVDESCERVYVIENAINDRTGCELIVEEFKDHCVTVCYTPNECDTTATFDVIVVPKRDCCKVDCRLYEEWHDAVVNGALAEIHLMPQRPWTSGSASSERLRKFTDDIRTARNLRHKGRTTGPRRVTANQRYMGRGSKSGLTLRGMK